MSAGDDAPIRRFALIGSPNSGKTSLFNSLTGLRQKVANYAGVTVEHVEGIAHAGDRRVVLIDLPGTYSLEPLSVDERVTVDVLTGKMAGVAEIDGIVLVADSTALDRGLAAAAEVIALGRPTVLALTMIDEVKARGGSIDIGRLRRRLGIPVVGVVGNKGIGIDDLRDLLREPEAWTKATDALPSGQDAESIRQRFEWAQHVANDCTVRPKAVDPRTEALDRVLLHPVAGIGVFLLAMMVFFQVVFAVAAPIQDLFEGGVASFGSWIGGLLPDGLFRSLLVDGVIAGVGSVVVFVPQIALLLVLIAVLEGTGYMARAAFIIDRVMGWVGLEGRSFVALLSSYACAIPGIMAARTVPDPRARLTTILVAPLMTCSARLPVYGLLIGAFVPQHTVLGVLNLQGLTLFGLYLLGALSAFVAAALMRTTMRRGQTWPFYMQLPPYRLPTSKAIFEQVLRGVTGFLQRAGTVILVGSIAIWALLSFPRYEMSEADVAAIEAGGGDVEAELGARQIEQSAAAAVGKAIAPLFKPLGYDWKINVGLIASFGAREVIVATLGQIYAFGDAEDDLGGLGERMRREERDGRPAYTLATALSLLMFYVYALQCVSTLAVIRRETGSARYAVLAWIWLFVVAWVAAFATYRIALALGG
jgi:ferrous iron transport protein B